MKNSIVFLVVILLSCGFSGTINSQNQPLKEFNSEMSKGYKIGDKATDFNLKNVDGKVYALADMKNAKGYIVVFTSNVCPFALLYEDRLIELHNKMAPRGYPVVAINSNDPTMQEEDNFAHMKIRASEKNFPFVYLKDADQKIYPQYGATKTPHVFLLDKALTVQYIGAIDDNAHSPEDVIEKYVENAIAALDSGKKPDPNQTKAIGCPIKSKSNAKNDRGSKRGERRGPPSPEKILEMMDKDNDQKISLSEAHGPLKDDFKEFDKNNDGFLTREELSSLKNKKRRRN